MDQIQKANRYPLLIGLVIWGALSFFPTFSYGTTAEKDIPLKISKETTLITEPLKSNEKEVDYFRAVELEAYPPNMKTDENGFRMVLRAIGVSPDNDSPELAAQTYQKVGLDPATKPTMTFQGPYYFLLEYARSLPASQTKNEVTEDIEYIEGIKIGYVEKFAEKLDKKLQKPWTLDEMPMMADWLKANGPAINLIAKAARQPSFASPLTRYSENHLLLCILQPEVFRHRHFAQALSARANYRIAKGDLDGAIDDTLACKALGRHVGRNKSAVDLLTGISMEAIANQVGIASSLEHPPTEAQLQRLLDSFIGGSSPKMPARGDIKKTLLAEQYIYLDIVQTFAVSNPQEKAKSLKYLCDALGKKDTHYQVDWNTFIKRANFAYEHPENFKFDKSKIDRKQLQSIQSRSEVLGDMFAKMFLPSAVTSGKEVFNRAECIDRLQAITLAMLIYEKQHGQLPPAWTVDEQGKPLHSWRALLLPYLGEEAKKLYEKIRLDEPWDSEHNRQFHATEIPFYQCPSAELTPGQTAYTVVVGPKTAFRNTGQGMKLDEFGPNSANLLLVTERKKPVCWMKPTAEVCETDVQTKLGSKHSAMIYFGFRGGNVTMIFNYIIQGVQPIIPGTQSKFSDKEYPSDTFQKLLEGTAEAIPSL